MDGLDSSDGVRAVPGVAADLGPGTVGRASGLRCESRLKLWIVLVAGRRRENIFWFRNDNEVFLNVLKETSDLELYLEFLFFPSAAWFRTPAVRQMNPISSG